MDDTVHDQEPAAGAGGGEERAADSIIRELERQIVSGELPEGQPLPVERDLMARFGSSRTVVREAIAALSNRGLVEHRPRFRPVIRKPGYDAAFRAAGAIAKHLVSEPRGVKNLYESRVFLERALAREAAGRARKQDIEDLRRALAANREAIPDSARFYETDVVFHGVFYGIPRNPVFPAIHRAYTAWLAPHWLKMLRSEERNAVNFRSHEAIFHAVVERDPDAAEEALVNHLRAAWEYVRVTFDEE